MISLSMTNFKKAYVSLFTLTLIVLICSCDGRRSKNQALKESVETFKKEVSVEVNSYIPKTYFEK